MLSDLRYRLRAIFRRRVLERDLDDELRDHLARQIEHEIRGGATPSEAARRARASFGGIDDIKEQSRDVRGVSILDVALRDLRYAVRILLKQPAFTTVAILSLTLGIGANTAMFQLLNALTLQSLPVAAPEQLVEIRMRSMEGTRGNFLRSFGVTNPLWERIREVREPFTGLFAWSEEGFDLSRTGDVRPARGLWVSGDFFRVLGVTPIAGRVFSSSDDRRECGLPGAVISYDFWQREFDGDPSIIGRPITLNSQQVDVIGVTPARFFGVQVGRTFDLAVPICSFTALRPAVERLDSGTTWWLSIMGRLKADWSEERATAYLGANSAAVFAATLPPNYPRGSVQTYLASSLIALPSGGGLSGLRDVYRGPLTLLLAMTGLVLLMACANLANLMLARSTARSREFALRLAIGASPSRLVSQLLTEALVISVASTVGGVWLARIVSGLLIKLLSQRGNPIVLTLAGDWRVFAFLAVTAMLTCIMLGLAPVLRATRASAGDALKTGSRGMTDDRSGLTIRRALIVVQVAVSLILVVGALIFVRSFRNLTTIDTGFERKGVLLVSANLPPSTVPPEVGRALRQTAIERLRARPDVAGVAESTVVPLSGATSGNKVWLNGDDRAQPRGSNLSAVSPGYFAALRIPLLAGRDFSADDTPASAKVAIVNEAFAKIFAGGGNPVGQQFWIESTPTTPETLYEIVGLVRDAKYRLITEDPKPVAFLALYQNSLPLGGATLLVRSTSSLDALVPVVKQTFLDINPNYRFVFRDLDSQINDTLIRDRAMATISGLFGVLAALLAAVGLHGLISYTVVRRRREIGIRMALGASRRTIVRSLVREHATWVATGLCLGVPAAIAVIRTARTLLFGLAPYDPTTLSAAVVSLMCVSLAASYVPARRAARVAPMSILKDE
jgi:putative ABC transport system permease protein